MDENAKKKILIVEDEPSLSRVLELKLAKSGFDTRTAPNGIEGLKLLKQEHFDLVLLDLIMPKMNGFDMLSTMRQGGDNTPVIVSSNLSQEADRKRVADLGAIDYVIKGQESILSVVKKVQSVLAHD